MRRIDIDGQPYSRPSPAGKRMQTPPVEPRRQAELWAIRKTQWSLEEYRALADRYADAVQSFQIAVENEHFAGIRSAYLTLEEIAFQTAKLNTGLFHAIGTAQQEYKR